MNNHQSAQLLNPYSPIAEQDGHSLMEALDLALTEIDAERSQYIQTGYGERLDRLEMAVLCLAALVRNGDTR